MSRQLVITYYADRDMLGLVSDEDYEAFKDILLEQLHKEWPKAAVTIEDGEHAGVEVEIVDGDYPTAKATRDDIILATAQGMIARFSESEVDYVVITAGTYDILIETVCEDNEGLLHFLAERLQRVEGVRDTETFSYLRLVKQTYQFGTR